MTASAPSTPLQLIALPARADNYVWVLHNGREAVVCDPAEADGAVAALQRGQLALAAILITHHHHDHIGGVEALYRQCGTAATQVYLPAADGLSGNTFAAIAPQALRPCRQGDTLQLLGLRLDVLDVPGHTAGHIAFYADVQPGLDVPFVLCGDALFSAGCGRVFEGTPAQMHHSLQKLAALPDATRVCCGHEYTLSNLRFAQAVEPDNAAIAQHIRRCEALRAQQQPTLPSRLQQEKTINPFLRVHVPAVQAAVAARGSGASGPAEVFAALRAWKDHF